MAKQILSCDWGTSSFRMRLVSVDNATVLKETVANKGIAAVCGEWLQTNRNENERISFYKRFLQSVLDKDFADEIKDLPIVISGMASSSIGMKELAYSEIPFDLPGNNLNTFEIKADDICPHDIILISGLKTGNDVMRGEETMLLGIDLNRNEDAFIIFPGTHSKHVMIKNNTVVDFKTYMTGEVFNMLATKTVLSNSVIKNNDFNEKSFIKGVEEAATGNLLNSSFHARTNLLFKKYTAEENYHFLSGLIIGAELKELETIPGNIYLVCSRNLLQQYITALKILNHNNAQYYDADEALIKAHCKLSRLLNI
jgi:2-dehydro-3-deoxygalactonokinase